MKFVVVVAIGMFVSMVERTLIDKELGAADMDIFGLGMDWATTQHDERIAYARTIVFLNRLFIL